MVDLDEALGGVQHLLIDHFVTKGLHDLIRQQLRIVPRLFDSRGQYARGPVRALNLQLSSSLVVDGDKLSRLLHRRGGLLRSLEPVSKAHAPTIARGARPGNRPTRIWQRIGEGLVRLVGDGEVGHCDGKTVVLDRPHLRNRVHVFHQQGNPVTARSRSSSVGWE